MQLILSMFQYKLQLFLQNARKQKIKPLFNRPISLLLLTSKAMEKSIHDQMQDYLQRTELL